MSKFYILVYFLIGLGIFSGRLFVSVTLAGLEQRGNGSDEPLN